ncbi:hypothetical protein ACNTMW_09205 [Planosporangium sp. 12N6]|uniref:hypothetical protein n=1 Tax=Planosporangium spinosum TaxID=3402278 RepID=UPI003CF6001E
MTRKEQPVSYAPQHRPVWRRFRRWCTCGLRWPCPDRFTGRDAAGKNDTGRNDTGRNDPHGNAPTVAYQRVGRPDWLTLTQRWRTNEGRW